MPLTTVVGSSGSGKVSTSQRDNGWLLNSRTDAILLIIDLFHRFIALQTTFLNDVHKSHKCTYLRQYHNVRIPKLTCRPCRVYCRPPCNVNLHYRFSTVGSSLRNSYESTQLWCYQVAVLGNLRARGNGPIHQAWRYHGGRVLRGSQWRPTQALFVWAYLPTHHQSVEIVDCLGRGVCLS